jgi:pimeloyl-ACP methyl ester carboxylesterase
MQHVLPYFSLCVFDFSGCGMSEGEYVTLGLKEREDAEDVIDQLKENFGLKNFFLWGRSMGAVTALLYGYEERKEQEKDVLALVVDSPFSCAKTMVNFCLMFF